VAYWLGKKPLAVREDSDGNPSLMIGPVGMCKLNVGMRQGIQNHFFQEKKKSSRALWKGERANDGILPGAVQGRQKEGHTIKENSKQSVKRRGKFLCQTGRGQVRIPER